MDYYGGGGGRGGGIVVKLYAFCIFMYPFWTLHFSKVNLYTSFILIFSYSKVLRTDILLSYF